MKDINSTLTGGKREQHWCGHGDTVGQMESQATLGNNPTNNGVQQGNGTKAPRLQPSAE